MTAITVKTNGQSLIVHSSSATLYTSSAYSTPVTLPAAIDADTTYYANPDNGNTALVVKQLDGTTVYSATLGIGPWVPSLEVAPVPTLPQLSADAPLEHLRDGSYYFADYGITSSVGSVTLDTLYLQPFIIPNDTSLVRLGAIIGAAGSAGAVFRLGIYEDDGYGGVGDLLLDASTIDGTSATVQEKTIAQAASKGLIWAGGAGQVAAPGTMDRAASVARRIPIPYRTTTPTSGYLPTCVVQTGVTGALPATLSAPAASTAFPPRVFFKTA